MQTEILATNVLGRKRDQQSGRFKPRPLAGLNRITCSTSSPGQTGFQCDAGIARCACGTQLAYPKQQPPKRSWKCNMNRLIERGLLENRATRVGPDHCLPLRMQSGGWAHSPGLRVRLSRPLRTSILLGLSGGISALGCQACLRAAPTAVAAILQALIVAITVMLVHARVSRPRTTGPRVPHTIRGSAASN